MVYIGFGTEQMSATVIFGEAGILEWKMSDILSHRRRRL